MMASMLGWPKLKILWTGEKTIIAIWVPHRMQSSLAFLNRPALRFEKVTCETKIDLTNMYTLKRPQKKKHGISTRPADCSC